MNPNAPVDVSVLAVLKIDAVDTDAIVLIPIQPGDAGIQYNFSEILMNEAPAPPPVSPPPPPSSPLTPLAPTHLPMPPEAPFRSDYGSCADDRLGPPAVALGRRRTAD